MYPGPQFDYSTPDDLGRVGGQRNEQTDKKAFAIL